MIDGMNTAKPGEDNALNREKDQAEIDKTQGLIARIREALDLREDRVDEVRKQISSGTHMQENKLEAALDELVQDFIAGL
jgi:hypothetical protein